LHFYKNLIQIIFIKIIDLNLKSGSNIWILIGFGCQHLGARYIKQLQQGDHDILFYMPIIKKGRYNMYAIGIFKLPEHNEVLHKDNFQKVFEWFHQFGMLYHLFQRQPII